MSDLESPEAQNGLSLDSLRPGELDVPHTLRGTRYRLPHQWKARDRLLCFLDPLLHRSACSVFFSSLESLGPTSWQNGGLTARLPTIRAITARADSLSTRHPHIRDKVISLRLLRKTLGI